MLNTHVLQIVKDKMGVEIGGPSPTAGLIYPHAKSMDNVIFSNKTVWSTHSQEDEYDFLFSSHSLEHVANPLKAIRESLRVVKHGGYLILILPEKSLCFDHKREYSKFSTLLTQYEKNAGEDDLSTLPEILKLHDLSMDPPAGNLESFTRRSLDNIYNRCLHHYVYDEKLLMEICDYFKCEFVYHETQGINRWFIMKKVCENPFDYGRSWV